MDIKKLQYLLSKSEGPKLDFKEDISLSTESSKKELARDVCAIANTHGGRGYIIFGIEDKTKRIIGISKEEFNEEKIQQIVSTRLDPPASITAEIINYNGKYIGILTIFNSSNRPHQLKENGAFYIRRGSTTDFMHKEEIAYMLQEYGLVHVEQIPIINARQNDLDENLLKEYFYLAGINYNQDESQLISSGFLYIDRETKKIYPTLGGILLFSTNPQIYLPHSTILIRDFSKKPINIEQCSGNLMQSIKNTSSIISNVIKSDYIDIINFCIAKAVIERNYLDINKPINVNIFKDNIEIIVPGLFNRNHFKKIDFNNIWLYFKLLTLDVEKKFLYPNLKRLKKIKTFENPSYETTKIIIR